jgi:hypothetical protein
MHKAPSPANPTPQTKPNSTQTNHRPNHTKPSTYNHPKIPQANIPNTAKARDQQNEIKPITSPIPHQPNHQTITIHHHKHPMPHKTRHHMPAAQETPPTYPFHKPDSSVNEHRPNPYPGPDPKPNKHQNSKHPPYPKGPPLLHCLNPLTNAGARNYTNTTPTVKIRTAPVNNDLSPQER